MIAISTFHFQLALHHRIHLYIIHNTHKVLIDHSAVEQGSSLEKFPFLF